MSFTKLMFSICSNPEKRQLKRTMSDPDASDETKQSARKRYDDILRQELELGSRLLTYVSQWTIFKKAPTPPPSID